MAESGDLFVTGLPAGFDEERVRPIFAQYGPVKSLKVLAARSDKPDVAAIVSMESPDQAKWLIENVSGKVPQGLTTPIDIKRKIVQDNSKGWGGKGAGGYMPQWAMYQMMQWYGKGKGGGKGKGWGGGLSSFPAEKKVWVGNVPEGVTYQELQAHFNTADGSAKFATVLKGKGAGTGGVAFATAEEATEAIAKLNGSTLNGASLVVDVWTKKEKEEERPDAA